MPDSDPLATSGHSATPGWTNTHQRLKEYFREKKDPTQAHSDKAFKRTRQHKKKKKAC